MQAADIHSGQHGQRTTNRGKRRHHVLPIARSQSVLEWVILVLLLLPVAVGPWLFGAVRLWSIVPLILVICLASALFFIRYLFFDDVDRIHIPPGGLFASILVIAWAAAIPFASVPYEAVAEILKLTSYVLAYWIWSNLASHHKRWRWLIACILLSATFMAWYALIQQAHESRMVLTLVRPISYGMRASGAYICPNHFAHYLELFLPVCLALALCPSAGFPLRLFSVYGIFVMLPPLYLTQSRSGWLGAMVGMGVTTCLFALRKSVKRFVVTLLLAPLMAAAVGVTVWTVSPMVQTRIASARQGDVRLSLWKDTGRMIQTHPWVGFGLGSYRWIYPQYQQFVNQHIDPQFAHNEYLHTWAEAGFVGLLLFGCLAIYLFIRLFRLMLKTEREKDALLVMGLLGSMAASATHAFFDYNMHIFANVHVLVAILGISVSGLFASGDISPHIFSTAKTKKIIGGFGLAVSFLLLCVGIRLYLAYGFSLLADRQKERLELDRAEQFYHKSLHVDSSYELAYVGLGHVMRIRSFWNLDRKQKLDQATESIRFFDVALKYNSWDTEALYAQSKVYASIGNNAKALELCRDLVKRAPYRRSYLSELGLRLSMAGELQESLAVFRRAAELGMTPMIDANIRWLNEEMKPKPDALKP